MEFKYIYTLRSKLRLFNTRVKAVLLYGSETWKINEGDNRKCCQVLKTNPTNSMAIRCFKSISTKVKLRRWTLTGHILRMDKNSNCETALTWTPEGRRKKVWSTKENMAINY